MPPRNEYNMAFPHEYLHLKLKGKARVLWRPGIRAGIDRDPTNDMYIYIYIYIYIHIYYSKSALKSHQTVCEIKEVHLRTRNRERSTLFLKEIIKKIIIVVKEL